MKVLSIIMILTGLYLMINSENNSERQPKHRKIEYPGKYKNEKKERLVEVIDPEWDIKHPKSN